MGLTWAKAGQHLDRIWARLGKDLGLTWARLEPRISPSFAKSGVLALSGLFQYLGSGRGHASCFSLRCQAAFGFQIFGVLYQFLLLLLVRDEFRLAASSWRGSSCRRVFVFQFGMSQSSRAIVYESAGVLGRSLIFGNVGGYCCCRSLRFLSPGHAGNLLVPFGARSEIF